MYISFVYNRIEIPEITEEAGKTLNRMTCTPCARHLF
jgi:hypothetical protein